MFLAEPSPRFIGARFVKFGTLSAIIYTGILDLSVDCGWHGVGLLASFGDLTSW